MVNISSQKARIFFSFETVDTKRVGDQEKMNIHHDDGAPDDVIVELHRNTGGCTYFDIWPPIDRARPGDSAK